MSQAYFSTTTITPLSAIARGSKIHVVGVAGVAMAQLAMVLAERGFKVSGSDKDFYEPMGSLLRNSAVSLKKGYQSSNVPADCALAVIGNVVSAGHPETDEIERRRIPYSIFPRLLFDLAIHGRHSIVVTGTHGKTTTTGLIATMFAELHQHPSYFVGGAVRGLPSALDIGAGAYSVVEGDEYDSAFFAKVPKFTFYKPDTLIINAIEYDHADIYPNLESIVAEFEKLLRALPPGSRAICCFDFPEVQRLVEKLRGDLKAEIFSFGKTPGVDYQIEQREVIDGEQHIRVRSPKSGMQQFKLRIPGAHNAANGVAALIVAEQCGFDLSAAGRALARFEGVARRQEVRFHRGGIVIVDDFAHHPTAVRETIGAMRQQFPNHRVVAVFEPRSNTSRRKVFHEEYVQAFRAADSVVLCEVTAKSIDPLDELISVTQLAADVAATGISAVALDSVDSIAKHLMRETHAGVLLLIMSNGSFGGLVGRLVEEFDARVPR